MPVDVIFERLLSRPLEMSKDPAENKATLLFKAGQTYDEQELIAALDSGLPPTFTLGIFTLKLQGYTPSPEGNGWWHVEARYARRDFFDPEFRVNTVGGTAHINLSLETTRKVSVDPAKVPINFKGAIGVDGQTVHGCDVHRAGWEWEETHIKPAADVDWGYIANLWSLTGKTNLAIFRIFDPDEVLFLGAQGSIRGGDYWQFTYRFLGEPNRLGTVPPFNALPIGSTGKTIEKLGHEYLWFRCADSNDAASGKYVRQPVAAYTERVYEKGDFGLLELPADPLAPPAKGGVTMEEARARLRERFRQGVNGNGAARG